MKNLILIGLVVALAGCTTPSKQTSNKTQAASSAAQSSIATGLGSSTQTIQSAYNSLATKYVNTDKLNVRNAPGKGKVVSQLNRGQSVVIYERKGNWERISQDSEAPKWVFTSLLCNYADCHFKR